MKILIVTQFYYPEPFRVHEIAEKLANGGHIINVLTTYPNYPHGFFYDGYKVRGTLRENLNGVEITRIPSRPRGKSKLGLVASYLSFYKRAKKYLKHRKEVDFDVVYCYQTSPILQAIPAKWLSKKYDIPFYIYCLDIWPESIRDVFPNKKSIVYKSIKNISIKIYNSATKIGVTSKSFIPYLHSECSVPNEKLVYLPQHADDIADGVDLTTIENGCMDIVFTGNVGESQNMDQIIDAVKLLADLKDFIIHVVGSGSVLKQTQERVKKEGLSEKIIFYGKRPYKEMVDFYRLADACLLTLSNKTQTGLTVPGKLQGYMAAGKPIIASINGDAADIIREANCGICIPADDVQALADALRDFICNRENYIECGKRARKYYEENFTLKRHIDALNKQLYAMVEEK